jgi:hypothetical protein
MLIRRGPAWVGLLLAVGLVVAVAAGVAWNPSAASETLPSRLTDAEFWQLTTDISEVNGSFRSDNLLSNELWMQAIIPELTRTAKTGRVYMGVGPEQNFTYITALKPKMAFIVDVRRGNLDLHLMYKALFEMSANRVEFVSRLFSKPKPEGVDKKSSASEIFEALTKLDSSETLYKTNLLAITDHLTTKHSLALSPDDLDGIEYVYHAFFEFGPMIQYSSSTRNSPGGYFGGRNQPTYADLMVATDAEGVARSYLATEDRFAFLKDLESRNMLVPVVGNFGGPRAIRRVGAYLKEKNATVSAFYLSNVEQYLRQDGIWNQFCTNVATLPLDDSSMFIRSVRGGRQGPQFGFGLNSQLGPMYAETKNCAPDSQFPGVR